MLMRFEILHSTCRREPCCLSPFSVLQEEVPGTVPGTNELSDAKSARVLGSEITQAGVAVYDALQHERELQDARQRYAIASNFVYCHAGRHT